MKSNLIILLFMCFSFGYSQNYPTAFSLQEAIDYALENNRQAKNASRDIEAARQQKWEAIATGLPQLDANVNYQNFLKQQVSVVPAEFFGGNPGEFAEVIFGTQQNAAATATVSQLIFDGSYIVGLQSAKVFLEISENAKIKTDLEIRKAVINAYGNVLLAKESVNIATKNKEVLEKNLNETRKIYENGLEEQESVEQLQITLSNLTSYLNNAIRLEDIALQMLNITLGIDYNASIVLTDDLEALALRNMDGSMLLASNDVKSTIDYLIAENDTESKALLLKLEKSRALPTLNAFVNGSYTAFDNDFVFFDSSTKWFGASLFGLNLDIPIFSSGKRSAASQRARINLEIAQTELTETEQRLQLQLERAKSDYKFAIEDYDNKKQNLNLAERIELKNQTKFFEGVGSSFDLRQAQTQLYAAQQELLQAMLDVINTKAELETVLNKPNNN